MHQNHPWGPRARRIVLAAMPILILSLTGVRAQTATEGRRLVAIGDIHGAYDAFVRVLQAAELIDSELHWSGGDAVFVQTGDILDRGTHVKPAMDLLMRLQQEAAAAGGQAIVLLGNHEILNLIGEIRDTTPDIWATFVPADEKRAKKNLEEAFKEYSTVYFEEDPAWRRATRPQRNDIKEKWIADQAPGRVEYLQAVGPDSDYGKWLRSLPMFAVVHDILFTHAGLSPQLAAWSLEDIDKRIAAEIEVFDGYRSYLLERDRITSFADLSQVIRGAAAETGGLEWFEPAPMQLNKPPDLPSPDLKGLDRLKRFEPLLQINGWWALAEQGPMWYRGYAQAPDGALQAVVPSQLGAMGLRAVVAAHTPQIEGIRPRLEGQVYLIDTGMLTSFYGGKGAALVFEGDDAYALSEDGSRAEMPPLPAAVAVTAGR